MSNLEKIQSAEDQLGQVQDALSMVQQGLEHAESVAVVAEKAKSRARRLLKIGVVVGLVALVLLLLSRRQKDQPTEAETPAS